MNSLMVSLVREELSGKTKKEEIFATGPLTAGTPVASAIQEKLKLAQEEKDNEAAEQAVELLKDSEDIRQKLLTELREVRAREKAIKDRLKGLYNGEQHVLAEGAITPLAFYVYPGKITVDSFNQFKKQNHVPDYHSLSKVKSK